MHQPTSTLRNISRRQFTTGALGIGALGALSACGNSSPSTGAASAPQGSNNGGSRTCDYANKGMDFFFFVAQSESIKRATEALGLDFQTSDAKQDASAQFNNWNSALLQNPRWIISDPIDSEALAPLTQRAKNQHTPVGIIDTPLTAGVADFTIAFDNRRGGEMAAEKIVELLKKKYGAPRGRVLNCYGALSSFAWRLRKEGFEAVLAKYPGIQLISRPTEGAETTARAVAASTLSQYPDLDAAHAPSDSITRGILTSLKGAGKAIPAGQANHVILTSIDGEPQSLDWARQGLLDAEVSQDPVAYGQICVEMLEKYSGKGKPVPLNPYVNKKYFWETAPVVQGPVGPNCIIPPYYIDATNVEDPRQWGNVVTKQWGMKQT